MTEAVTMTKGELFEAVWTKPIATLAQEIGISPNGLAKICDRLDIPRPPKGYWRQRGSQSALEKPEGPSDPDEKVTIGAGIRAPRQPRARLAPEERRAQMIEAARLIATEEGVHQLTLKEVAKRLRMSEAQAHNVFSTREDLLVALAQDEIDAFEAVRRDAVSRGGTRIARVVMSSLSYLRAAATRGPLLHTLIGDSGVRKRVETRRNAIRSVASERAVSAIIGETSLSPQEALASLAMTTAMVVRAGALVAEKRIEMEDAEAVVLPIIINSALGDSAISTAAEQSA